MRARPATPCWPTTPRLAAVALALAAALAVAACTSGGDGTPAGDGTAPPAAVGQVEPLTRADVEAAVATFTATAEEAMADTGLPGLAYAVVFDDEVVAAGGLGVRELGQPGAVDADTVFQIASVSKPMASTVVAGLVGQGHVAWDDPVRAVDRTLALSDPWVTDHVTHADLFSHRSGLPDHAGDLLEDLGYDRAEVLFRLHLEPLAPFRASSGYTNFGLTASAVAAAAAAGLTWEDAAEQVLYQPLGMASTSSRFADYEASPNRAVPHVTRDGVWQVTPQQRQPDAQSPAGGVSSSASDMAQWVRLQLGRGTVDGVEVVDADALAQTHLPHLTSSPPRAPFGRPGFAGLGWNVSYDDHGRLRLGHAGAFLLGTGTAVELVPAEGLGVVVLTNGEPLGVADALVKVFVDLVLSGAPQEDWFGLYLPVYEDMLRPEPPVDLTTPPPSPSPARELAAYVGPARVVEEGGALVLELGPAPERFALAHHDGDVFWFQPRGENAALPSDATFAVDPAGAATLTVGWLDGTGLGTFTRP